MFQGRHSLLEAEALQVLSGRLQGGHLASPRVASAWAVRGAPLRVTHGQTRPLSGQDEALTGPLRPGMHRDGLELSHLPVVAVFLGRVIHMLGWEETGMALFHQHFPGHQAGGPAHPTVGHRVEPC